jgi:hypothetical protein
MHKYEISLESIIILDGFPRSIFAHIYPLGRIVLGRSNVLDLRIGVTVDRVHTVIVCAAGIDVSHFVDGQRDVSCNSNNFEKAKV